MKLILAAVGQKLPAWANTAYEDYAKRFPPDCRLELKAVKAEPRSHGKPVEALMAAERARLEAALPRGCRRVVLDERGSHLTTTQRYMHLSPAALQGAIALLEPGGQHADAPVSTKLLETPWRRGSDPLNIQ